MQHLRATQAEASLIKQKAQEIHDFVAAHKDDGVFLVHNQRLSLSRKLRRYGVPQPAATRPADE